jgi:hypothetical protein
MPNFFSLAARKSWRVFIGSGVAAKVAPPDYGFEGGAFSKSETYNVHVKTLKIL